MIAKHGFLSAMAVSLFLGILSTLVCGQQYSPDLYQNMRWRSIGPFRGGRTVGATGVPGQQNVFYIGVNNGGVWKTDDFGRTWAPIFDDQSSGSIGALAVAPSNPDIVYVGSGEGLQRPDLSTGDGMYKSMDAGKTWQHLGLRDAQQIGAIIIDPRDPNRLFVAVLGHPYGPNAERGVFRSTNGGQTFDKVLYKDEDTGAIALAFDPTNPQIVYADMWAARQGPWENGSWQGPNSGLFKSTDGGNTWHQLTKGLPTTAEGLGRIGFCVAPSDPNRMYAMVDAPRAGGVYRSDDAGESWTRVNNENRVWGRGSDFAEVKADPKNKDVIYVANTSTYRSTDAGQDFTAFKGAPGGDDYHTVWINPENNQIILLASDQGAVISVNGGRTWSSWYNQPTAQFYHVNTDDQFPYHVFGGQQESGSAEVSSRGNDGEITFREFHPVGAEEYGYVAPDPLNPNIVYGGKVTRYNRITGQVQNVSPGGRRGGGQYRFLRTAPLIFSEVDKHVLFYGGNVVFKTINGGQSWQVISPDLSREHPDVPASIGVYRTPELATMARRGVVYTIAPSYHDINTIWAGTDDGLIHVTRDGGKTWKNVTPPELTSWSKVSIIDAGRFDSQTAYAAINRIRLDDMRPHIYRTHDGGKTWKEIINGLPNDAPVNSVREDPVRKGLLFAGTERTVYVSFDDGDHWQSLRLNLPPSSVRDIVVHKDDLVAGTHGRGFWILDDITPLRQIDADVAAANAYLFKPEVAYRIKRDTNTDTPLPPEEPAGKNPPDGAIINYYLKGTQNAPVVLEIFGQNNKLITRFASDDKPEPINDKELNVPTYWVRRPQVLSAQPGMQRFVWNLHYPAPPNTARQYPISAIYMDTPSEPQGPAVMPGQYTVKLSAGGETYTQTLTVKLDPRVKILPLSLAKQFSLSMKMYEGQRQAQDTIAEIRKLTEELKTLHDKAGQGALADAITALSQKATAIAGAGGGGRFGGGGGGGRGQRQAAGPTLASVSGELIQSMETLQGADAAPTSQAAAAAEDAQKSLDELLERWDELKTRDLKALNDQLKAANLPPVSIGS